MLKAFGMLPARLWLSLQHVERVARVARWVAFGLLVLYAVSYVQFAMRLIGYPYGIDQGEGYDAWSAWLLPGFAWMLFLVIVVLTGSAAVRL